MCIPSEVCNLPSCVCKRIVQGDTPHNTFLQYSLDVSMTSIASTRETCQNDENINVRLSSSRLVLS